MHWLEDSHTDPKGRGCTAVNCFYIELVVPKEGSGCSFVPEENQLCFTCKGRSCDEHRPPVLYVYTYTHVHAHVVPAQGIISDTKPQWQCLGYTELS